MDLAAYLARIGYEGAVAPEPSCLWEIHRRHLLAIPYENLDVQLGRPLDLDPERIFDKLVTRRRGGWCYEMNGLLGQALEAIGFRVTRMVGGVMRRLQGDGALGNHLVLRVDIDGVSYLADVGIGDGPLEPMVLREGTVEQAGRSFRLEALGEGSWRFANQPGVIPPDFDISPVPDEPLLARTCRQLQQDEGSLFRQNLICMQPDGEGGMRILLGRVLSLPDEKRLLEDVEDFRETLADCFGLDDPVFAELWPAVAARHEAVFGEEAAAAIPGVGS